MKGWLIRAQQPRRKRIYCKGQNPSDPCLIVGVVRLVHPRANPARMLLGVGTATLQPAGALFDAYVVITTYAYI